VDPNLLRLAGDALNGVTCASSKITIASALPDSDPQKAGLMHFIADFQTKYGRGPSMFAGNGADSLKMLSAAIQKGGTSAQKIRDEIEGFKNFIGLNYVFSYAADNHFGVQSSSLALMTVRDLKFVPIS